MNRRSFMAAAVAQTASAAARHIVGSEVEAAEQALPEGVRLRPGWKESGVPAILRFPTEVKPERATLRVSVAIEIREPRKLEAYLPQSGRLLGVTDIRYGHFGQPHVLELNKNDVAAVLREGLGLRPADGEKPVWFIHPDTAGGSDLDPLRPHLLFPGRTSRKAEFERLLLSLCSLQPFGWMAGRVLDGLCDLEQVMGQEPGARGAGRALRCTTASA